MPECKVMEVCQEKFKAIEKRLDIIDKLVEKIQNLSISVESLAQSSKFIVEKQVEQNKRLDSIEAFGFAKYKGIVKALVFALIGAVITYLFKK